MNYELKVHILHVYSYMYILVTLVTKKYKSTVPDR
jgi:hypothetical protein